ncbi:diaminopimelate epimerase [Paenibacillus lemnae]|nr:diaminopimelate epimerase [Paenibacillus lemnae]
MTILVESHHHRDCYQEVASRLMAYDHVFAEQVGFIEAPRSDGAWARLHMMAGEFCGNAAMSLAVVMAWKQNLLPGEQLLIPLEVSGSHSLLLCQVKADPSGFTCKVDMPLPSSIVKTSFLIDGCHVPAAVIRFSGIVHVILQPPCVDERTKAMAQKLITSPDLLQGESAVGIMLYQSQSREMTPLIYIPEADSLVWERGCGSGAAALGAFLAAEAEISLHIHIRQPGGSMEVWAQYDNGRIFGLSIQGHVDISAAGIAYV